MKQQPKQLNYARSGFEDLSQGRFLYAKGGERMTILEDLWHGNIQPMEWGKYRIEEHRDLVRLFERVESQMKATLNDSQKEELQKLKDLGDEMQMITECGAFIMGFRLGVQLVAASLVEPAQG